MIDQNENPDTWMQDDPKESNRNRNKRDLSPPVYPLKKKLVLALAGAILAVVIMIFLNFFQNGVAQERMKAVALADIIPSEPLPGDEELFDEDGVPEGKPRRSFFNWWYRTFGHQSAPMPVPSLFINQSLIATNNPTSNPKSTPAATPIAVPLPFTPVVLTPSPAPSPGKTAMPTPLPSNPVITDDEALQRMVDETAPGSTLTFNGNVNLNGGTLRFAHGITLEGTGTLSNGYLRATGITGLTIRGLTFQGVQVGLSSTRNTTIEQCELVDWHPVGFTENIGGLITVNGNTSGLTLQNNTIRDVYYVTAQTGEDPFGISDPPSTYGCGIKIEASGSTLSNIRIIGNRISRTQGPGAIWIGGRGSTFTDLYLLNNHIFDTESNGIAFFWYETGTSSRTMFTRTLVSGNTIENIGSLRQKGRNGHGGNGIYANVNTEGIQIVGNTIDTVLEMGIAGWYGLVQDNTIRNTGADQLHHPTEGSAGIYGGGSFVIGNTIINPGRDGGLYYASDSLPGPTLYRNNVIRNASSAWKPSTTYAFGTRVYSGTNWYVCVKGGTSSTTGPSGTTGSITDGSCTWDWQHGGIMNVIGHQRKHDPISQNTPFQCAS